ncbi:uncharacterized protein PAC_19004 [Phialocephala subalpina]|uniref:SWI/SNF and RSC complexes subunit ssr4 n=1 Tax=Phialocephala subalpina TaxID=576137 RepID=A0A1L7XVN9_9HELO|nr:uncharacterized protein PAC_19004 [Phialocephala subalpina]
MQDPSQGIQRELQPHVHLVSAYRLPAVQQLHPDRVSEWLLAAPKISRDQSPFYWTYLDRPADHTVLLVWQSPSTPAHEYASDGYIWPPQETAFQVEVAGGYILEMYQHKTGYAPNETVAIHARRRYRLIPSRNSTSPGPDPALWVIHYTQAEPQDRMPSSVIPIDLRTQQMMQTRQYLHSQGQIVQKDFMLHDRASWPQIAFPRGPPRGPAMYGGNVPPARIPQQMAYPTTAHAAGPPAKRARTQTNVNQANAPNAVAVHDADDEEETSRGDLFDHLTPRDISTMRYKQNHEWMEEVLSSPYSLSQIIPADLGLGLRGEFGTLTNGIFDAPFVPFDPNLDKDPKAPPYIYPEDVSKNEYVGQLDAEKAEEFRKRAHEGIAQTNKEIEKMKAKHAKRMAKFQKGSLISIAEKSLRSAVNDPTDTGPEYWRLEGKVDEEDAEDGKAITRVPPKVADIVAQVEASVGRHAAAVKELIRIQDGGYEEALTVPTPQAPAAPTPRVTPPGPGSNNGSTHSGVLVGDADMDMSNSAAGLLDQYHTGLSSNATPASSFATPQPHLQAHSSAGTPNINVPSPQPQAQQQPQQDVQMADAGPSTEQTALGESSSTGGDWVVVPPGGVSPQHAPAQGQTPTIADSASTSTPTANVSAPAPVTAASNPSPHPATTAPTSSANTPGLPDFHTSPNDFADLGDLDTAGDALADLGYSGLDMDVGMDDSAFGDAFHGVEPRGDGGVEGEDGL